LTAKLDEETARWKILSTQLKKSQEQLRHSKRHLDNLEKSKSDLDGKIEELNLYNESAVQFL
jgi:UDP-glucose:O-linked fucose beta-1,3-glucosyltransferase